ncbi:SDR family oxidoreductase [Streptomyces sp. CRN 30]|uniref:SDR family NAD(P)-dependent oxidoreductase n=1 Tax=Streptomyces sp. CRN 30 TaxID=3075613 RepID=UPI002A80F5EF|nr:SDR family oxidoreductase [Streptomyces sp. CRN 30]
MSDTAHPLAPGAEGPGRVVGRRPSAVHPELAGTTAVVTGAARGMGAVFTEGLALRGVHVIAADIDLVAMKETAEAVNASRESLPEGTVRGRVVPAAVDVVDPAGHEELARLAHGETGRLDHWVNNAGIFPHAFVGDISPEQIDAVLKVNVQGVLFGSQAAARHMAPGGAIVNMSSVSAVRVRKGRGAYCASKASVAHLTESLAVELGDRGLRVNSIAPGYIDTEMTRWVQEDPAALAHALESVPLHRLGSPQEVLGVLLFLLSDSARYVTGHSIAVDGGSRHV